MYFRFVMIPMYICIKCIICFCFAAKAVEDPRTSLDFHLQEVFLNPQPAIPLLPGQQLGSDYIGQPVYISLTTIHWRLKHVFHTIQSILVGDMIPDHINLYVSKDPFLLDRGVTENQMKEQVLEPLSKLNISHNRVSIFTTENIGSHRKLLPILSQKWFEDCVVITIDDHEIYKKDAVSSLLKYYIASHRSAIVSLRAHRIALCMNSQPWKVAPYTISKKDKLWKGIHAAPSTTNPFYFR